MFNYIVKIVKLKAVNTIKAISLIEIIVAISIVFVLSAMSIYSYQDYKIKGQFNSAFATAEQDKQAIGSYYAANKACPADNFINNQTVNSQCTPNTSTPCIATITSTGCTLNLKDGQSSPNTILSFQAQLSGLGELQYFCVLGSPALSAKYLSFTCGGLPTTGGYTNP